MTDSLSYLTKATIVINLFAGPGSGKSTTAAGLFHLMKLRNFKCELVIEYAKELVYEDRPLEDGIMIFAQQHRRLRRVQNKVDYIITDAPLVMSEVYQDALPTEFHKLVRVIFNRFNNFNVFIKRVKPYQSYGRIQTEEKARMLDSEVVRLLPKFDLVIAGDDMAPQTVFNHLEENVFNVKRQSMEEPQARS